MPAIRSRTTPRHGNGGINMSVTKTTAICVGVVVSYFGLSPALLGTADAADLPAVRAPVVVAPPAAAAPEATWALGNWGGVRTDLYQKGVDFQFVYVEEAGFNPAGGLQTRAAQAGQLNLGATLDLQKLIGDPSATFQITIDKREGRNLNHDAGLDLLLQPIEVYGRGDIWRLTQFWYDQKFANGFLDWKIGKVTVGEDATSYPCVFMNLSFCGDAVGRIAGNYWFNYPIGQWGTRLRVNAPEAYATFGAYQMNPNVLKQSYGFNFDFNGGDGVLIPVELAWTPAFDGGRLPGIWQFTGWYASQLVTDVVFGPGLAPVGGRYGVSFQMIQQLTHPSADPRQGLSFFFTAIQLDRNTSSLDNQITAGLFYHGPFEGSPGDEIGVAVGRTQVNPRVTNAAIQANAILPGSGFVRRAEYPLEAYYNIHVYNGFDVRPNFQWIHCPGGLCGKSDVAVVGVKTVISF